MDLPNARASLSIAEKPLGAVVSPGTGVTVGKAEELLANVLVAHSDEEQGDEVGVGETVTVVVCRGAPGAVTVSMTVVTAEGVASIMPPTLTTS